MQFTKVLLFSVQGRNDLALYAGILNTLMLFVPLCQGLCIFIVCEWLAAFHLLLCASDVVINA